ALGAYGFSLLRDPVLLEWTTQNVTLSPPPWDYALAYGLPGLAAIAGAVVLWRSPQVVGLRPEASAMLRVWLVLGFLLIYVPLPFQRRLTMGLSFPIAILAAIGVHHVLLQWLKEFRVRNLVVGSFAVFSLISSVVFLTVPVPGALQLREPFYVSNDDEVVFTW